MSQEEYTRNLEAQNGYCQCPDLAELYDKRKIAEGIEAKCEFFRRNVDLGNPQPEDREILEKYQSAATNLEKAAGNYYVLLTNMIDERKLKLVLHHHKKLRALKSVDVDKALRLLRSFDAIITIHCLSCNQQIDLASQ